jgi:hypothetical protein
MAKIGEDSVDVLLDLIVGGANNLISCYLEPFGTSLIVVGLLSMHGAIDLQNHALLGTAKIDDKTPNHMLTPELEAIEPAATKATPKHRLGRRLLATELLRSYLHCCSAAPAGLGLLIVIHRTIASRSPPLSQRERGWG